MIDHSDNKAQAAPTWKKSFGHHPLLAFVDRPEVAGGEALAGLLRKGNAGSNTAADHITVLEQALDSLPADWRPDPQNPGGPAVVVRSDSAGATHRFAQACRDRGLGSPSVSPSTPASGMPWTPCTSPRAGIRRSTPVVTCAMGRGSLRPRPWSGYRPGLPGPG